MNMQAMMKQAQKLQNDMLKAKDEIDKTEFSAENGFVKIKMNGKKEILDVTISVDEDFELSDIEVLQDMIMIAVNETTKKIDKMTEEKLGKFTGGMPGLF